MIGPERRVHKMNILNSHILRIRNIGQTRTLRILIGTLRIPLTANPELLPVRQSVTVDGTLTRNGKAIQAVGIHQGAEIGTCLTLNTCLGIREVNNTVRAL